ncbi:MAG: hypothetical protein RLZZ03_1639, partial [Pseudomonadota bacterium]
MSLPRRKTGASAKNVSGTRDKLSQLEIFTAHSTGTLTSNQGVQIADNHNSLKAGLKGPTLLEDFVLREKLMHFDHERIPERVV